MVSIAHESAFLAEVAKRPRLSHCRGGGAAHGANLSPASYSVGPRKEKPRRWERGEGGGWVRKEGAGKRKEVLLPWKLRNGRERPPTRTSRELYNANM